VIFDSVLEKHTMENCFVRERFQDLFRKSNHCHLIFCSLF